MSTKFLHHIHPCPRITDAKAACDCGYDEIANRTLARRVTIGGVDLDLDAIEAEHLAHQAEQERRWGRGPITAEDAIDDVLRAAGGAERDAYWTNRREAWTLPDVDPAAVPRAPDPVAPYVWRTANDHEPHPPAEPIDPARIDVKNFRCVIVDDPAGEHEEPSEEERRELCEKMAKWWDEVSAARR